MAQEKEVLPLMADINVYTSHMLHNKGALKKSGICLFLDDFVPF